jgi:hypothetical protein
MVVFWLLCHIVILLKTNVLEKHTASIFMAEVRRVRKWMVYVGLGGGSDQEDWPVKSHRIRKGDGAMYGPIGKSPLQGTREEG